MEDSGQTTLERIQRARSIAAAYRRMAAESEGWRWRGTWARRAQDHERLARDLAAECIAAAITTREQQDR